MKIESDFAQLYCGVRQGRTNGGPIGIIIENKDYNEAITTEIVQKLSTLAKIKGVEALRLSYLYDGTN